MEEPKRNERVLIVGILLFVLIVWFLLIVLYSTKNKNQVKIYSISGESENFYYNNALFIFSFIHNSHKVIWGFLLIKSFIHFISFSVCSLGCLLNGLCDLSFKLSLLPSYFLFHLHNDVLDIWYFLHQIQAKAIDNDGKIM